MMAMDTKGMPYREVPISETMFNPPPLTIPAMTAQVREVNIAKGWRAPDGGMCPGQTFGDYIALAHSELSEALEAYRDHRLEDATESRPDPSECSCAMTESSMTTCPVHGYDAPGDDWSPKPEGVGSEFADLLIRLLDMADVFGIDLEREYVRKLAFNRTRAFQHGGRTLSDDEALNLGSRRCVLNPEEIRHLGDGLMTPVCNQWNRQGGITVVVADAAAVNCPACVEKIETRGNGPAGPARIRPVLDVLLDAIPNDKQSWWTCCDVDDFLSEWRAIGLPGVALQDGSGAQLTLWVGDLDGAAAMLGVEKLPYGATWGFELTKGAYTVCVLERKKGLA